MATVTADQTYKGTITAVGTVTVRGRGKARVKVDFKGGTGTIGLQDDLAETGTFDPIDVDGTDQSITTGTQSWYLEGYSPADTVALRLDCTAASSLDADVYVSFDYPPPIAP